jgi:integrase
MPTRNNVSFTRARADRLACPEGKLKKRLNLSNLQGLCIEVSKNGSKKWVFSKKIRGTNSVFTRVLGDYQALVLDEAIALATPFSQSCSKGIDPREKEEKEKRELEKKSQIESVTFKNLYEAYVLQRTPAWSKNSIKDHRQAIALPTVRSTSGGPLYFFQDLPLASINRDLVEAWIEGELALDRKTTTSRSRRLLFACLKWGLDQDKFEDLIDQRILRSRSIKTKTTANGTRASDLVRPDDLGTLTKALDLVQNPTIQAYLKTTLLLGCRREEVMALKWAYLDDTTQSTKINCKIKGKVEEGGGRSIPIGNWLWSQLQSMPREGEFIFHSSRSRSGRIQNPDKAFRQAKAATNISVTIHGLRRTYSAIADVVKVPPEIQHILQGHSPQSVRERNYKDRVNRPGFCRGQFA